MQIGGHAGFGRRIGDVDFGVHALDSPYLEVILDWYDFQCKGIQNEFATDKPVKLFLMGANEYRQHDDWPPPQAKYTKYFLHSSGKANSLRGDGTLSIAAPKSEASEGLCAATWSIWSLGHATSVPWKIAMMCLSTRRGHCRVIWKYGASYRGT